MDPTSDREQLLAKIRELAPWHQNIQITPDVDIRSAFGGQSQAEGRVTLQDARAGFARRLGYMFAPELLKGKRFLDCACNAGSYCFWARELGAESAFGFDVREHWIRQARFVQQHRTVGPTDGIDFQVLDLLQLPKQRIRPAHLVLFKGILYHLADPILGLKIAADLTEDVLWVNSAAVFDCDIEGLRCVFEATDKHMSGAHSLSWIPTGPRVIAMILYWLGFKTIWHMFTKRNRQDQRFGRTEVIASRERDALQGLKHIKGAHPIDTDTFTHAQPASQDIIDLL